MKVVVIIQTEDLKLLTLHECLFYNLLIINTFFKAIATQKTHFQLGH